MNFKFRVPPSGRLIISVKPPCWRDSERINDALKKFLVESSPAVIKFRLAMSNKDSEMQRLHQEAVRGKTLTAEERRALENWYETLDREENSILNDSESVQNISELRNNLSQTTKQIVKISREIEILLAQNEDLRKENQTLKKKLESRLSERVA